MSRMESSVYRGGYASIGEGASSSSPTPLALHAVQTTLSTPFWGGSRRRRLCILAFLGSIPLLMFIGLIIQDRSSLSPLTPSGIGYSNGGKLSKWGWGSLIIEGKNCYSQNFRKRTLKLIDEAPIVGLVGGKSDGSNKHEASGVVGIGEGAKGGYLVVFDNMFELGFIDVERGSGGLRVKSGGLVEWEGQQKFKGDSEFEAIVADGEGGYILVQEMVKRKSGKMIPVMWHVKLKEMKDGAKRIEVISKCPGDFQFSHENKGFEGVELVKDADGRQFLLGLCEGNFCTGGSRGMERAGNGRVVVMEKTTYRGKCRYRKRKVLGLPRTANFRDYSAMDVRGNKVAIVSQENSAVWIGKFKAGKDGNFFFHNGKVFDFPRNDACLVKYCNIEGVYWVSDNAIATVSDKMKSKGKQSFRCLEKDQMIHTFALPR